MRVRHAAAFKRVMRTARRIGPLLVLSAGCRCRLLRRARKQRPDTDDRREQTARNPSPAAGLGAAGRTSRRDHTGKRTRHAHIYQPADYDAAGPRSASSAAGAGEAISGDSTPSSTRA